MCMTANRSPFEFYRRLVNAGASTFIVDRTHCIYIATLLFFCDSNVSRVSCSNSTDFLPSFVHASAFKFDTATSINVRVPFLSCTLPLQ